MGGSAVFRDVVILGPFVIRHIDNNPNFGPDAA